MIEKIEKNEILGTIKDNNSIKNKNVKLINQNVSIDFNKNDINNNSNNIEYNQVNAENNNNIVIQEEIPQINKVEEGLHPDEQNPVIEEIGKI